MKAYIFIGGEVEESAISSPIPDDALVIAADSGYDTMKKLGIANRCNIAVGDFDSIKDCSFPSSVKVVRVPAEKDFTDTRLAIDTALEGGAEEIVLIGGLTGRLDHTLSNLYLIEQLTKVGIPSIIFDGNNRIHYLKERSSILIPRGEYKYFGIICSEKEARGVKIDGAKYTLSNASISRSDPSFAISNEVNSNFAMISCKKGGLFIIESNDLAK